MMLTEVSASIRSAVTSPGPVAARRITRGSSPSSFTTRFLTFRMMSVTSSITPLRLVNSCSAPLILTAVTAAPSSELRSTRRRLLPMVVPKPRSNGSTMKRP